MFQHNAFRSCYEDHHIVGQFAQNRQQFGDERIDSPENTVRIPTLRHLDINGWYSTPNAKYDGLSPRDYLRSKSWDEQMQVGLSAIKQYRVFNDARHVRDRRRRPPDRNSFVCALNKARLSNY
jgi:hypothetical protein